ncbi:MAG: hypothetical protein ACJ741_12250 [Pyrinomonadaceae bacterium]
MMTMRRSFAGVLSVMFLVLCLAPEHEGQVKRPDGSTIRKASPATKGTPSKMTGEADFDALARKATESGAIKDQSNLFGQAFALREWHFIARGKFPDVHPYIAKDAQTADGQYMIRAFTDTDRLLRFARENNLMEKDATGEENVSILSVPTDNIIDYLEQFISQGVYGIWFNSDTESDGFFVPLKQLRPIKAYLDNSSRRPSP